MWVANHDNNEEGTFTNWYTGQVGRPIRPIMPMSISALLVLTNFIQFLPAHGVYPMAHRSALWWGLPIQLHGVEGRGKLPVFPSQNRTFSRNLEILWKCTVYCLLLTLWNSVDAGGFRRWNSHKSWLQHWRRNLWGDLDSFPVLVAQVLHEIWLSHLYWLSWFFKMPTFCPLCEIAAPVRKVTIRGLCEQSIFDKWDKFLIHVYLN